MKVLIIAPYDTIYPPINGGMQRCYNIINQISLYCSVSLLTYQSKEQLPFSNEIEIFQIQQKNINKSLLKRVKNTFISNYPSFYYGDKTELINSFSLIEQSFKENRK